MNKIFRWSWLWHLSFSWYNRFVYNNAFPFFLSSSFRYTGWLCLSFSKCIVFHKLWTILVLSECLMLLGSSIFHVKNFHQCSHFCKLSCWVLFQEFKCEICGNHSYWGRRAFERHFKEWRHQHGMRCLGIPNTKNFNEITCIQVRLLYS